MIDKNKKNKGFLRGIPMMILSIIIVLGAVPIVMIFGESMSDIMKSAGVKMHPNLDDGYLIAEFHDPYDDLLRKLPLNSIYENAENALDIGKFSVKKVEFKQLSGMGIEPRLNLTFEFKSEFPNPFNSESEFSLPVIHVYINAPGVSPEKIESNKVAGVTFAGNDWNYQVIVDGLHAQARIFDTAGKLLGKGLGLYINYEYEEVEIDSSKTENRIKSTRITAGLPMAILGDPAKGEWSYYVLVGLIDSKNYSMMLPAENEFGTQIFDVVHPNDPPSIKFDAQSKVLPLKIKN